MSFDFDRVYDRIGSNCFKFDGLELFFGNKDLIPLWVADMDFAVAPVIQQALQERMQHPIYGYNLRPQRFYRALTGWFERRFGYRIKKEWVVCTPGIVPAINLAVLCYTNPGDGILIQTPVYQPFFEAVFAHDRKLLTNSLIEQGGKYTIDFADFELKIQHARLFILCSPHNPVGRVWTREELTQMAELCFKYKVPILSDEIHCDIVYPPHQHIPIASLDGYQDNVISCFSPSKSFNIAGLSTAVTVISDSDLRKKFHTINQDLHLYLGNSFGIAAFIAAYEQGDEWLDALILYLRANRDFLIDYVNKHLPQIKISIPEGTYLAWMDFTALGMNTEELAGFLTDKAGVALDPGVKYGYDGLGFMRFNFGCPQSVIQQALQRIETAIKNL